MHHKAVQCDAQAVVQTELVFPVLSETPTAMNRAMRSRGAVLRRTDSSKVLFFHAESRLVVPRQGLI